MFSAAGEMSFPVWMLTLRSQRMPAPAVSSVQPSRMPGITERPICPWYGSLCKPDSILKAAALLLRHICRVDAAAKLEKAINECPLTVKSDGSAVTCVECADIIMEML